MVEISLTQKIQKENGKTLRITRKQILDQMIDFYRCEDNTKMKELFEAYRDWEVRTRTQGTREETIDLARRNFDCLAKMADSYINDQNINLAALRMIQLEEGASSGPINEFYRNAIDYHPQDLSVN